MTPIAGSAADQMAEFTYTQVTSNSLRRESTIRRMTEIRQTKLAQENMPVRTPFWYVVVLRRQSRGIGCKVSQLIDL